MTRNEAKNALHVTITTILAEHPDLAGDACNAINEGVSSAYKKLEKIAAAWLNAKTGTNHDSHPTLSRRDG